MNIKFSKPKAIEQKDMIAFSQAIGCTLSGEVERFFLELNGSKPETNIFTVNEDNESGVNELIPVSKVLDERKYLDYVGGEVFPIAIAEGGNYVVIDFDKGQSVWFWDHEDPRNMTRLASSIYEFLDNLMPFDSESVELKDGQVESAWIDPDFFKSLK